MSWLEIYAFIKVAGYIVVGLLILAWLTVFLVVYIKISIKERKKAKTRKEIKHGRL